MFILQNAVKNIFRHRRRYLISGIFLFIVISVFAGAIYLSLYLHDLVNRAENDYLSQITLKFREDLQWYGNENYTEGMPPVRAADGSTHTFNDTGGTMDIYNIPLYVNKEYFNGFTNIYTKKVSLAYYEEVYGVYSSDINVKSYTSVLYGGDLDTLNQYYCKRYNIMFRFRLTDGVMCENGECLIHYLTADEYGYSIGDAIEYFDEKGKLLGSLKISGFFGSEKYDYLSNSYPEYTDDPQKKDSSFMLGSNPFFIQDCRFRDLIITGFDTAYYAYGDDESSDEFIHKHEFYKFITWYTLNSPDNLDAFLEAAKIVGYPDTHKFYLAEHLYHLKVDNAIGFGDSADTAAIVLLVLFVFIIFMLNIIITNERKHEIGILYSLGWNKKAVRRNFLYENLIFTSGFTLLSTLSCKLVLDIELSQNKYFERLGIIYRPDLKFLIILFGTALSVTALAVFVATKRIMKKTPAELLGS